MATRILGWVLLVGAGTVILNSVLNFKRLERDIEAFGYWGAVATDPAPGFSFMPPYTSFEIITMIAGAAGLVLIVFDARRRSRAREEE